jgi:hypothetical protein
MVWTWRGFPRGLKVIRVIDDFELKFEFVLKKEYIDTIRLHTSSFFTCSANKISPTFRIFVFWNHNVLHLQVTLFTKYPHLSDSLICHIKTSLIYI